MDWFDGEFSGYTPVYVLDIVCIRVRVCVGKAMFPVACFPSQPSQWNLLPAGVNNKQVYLYIYICVCDIHLYILYTSSCEYIHVYTVYIYIHIILYYIILYYIYVVYKLYIIKYNVI